METQIMKKTKFKKLAFSLVVGAIGGFIATFGLMQLVASGLFGEIDASRKVAAFVGSMYALCGVLVGFGALSPQMGASYLNLNVEDLQDQAAVMRNSAIGCAAFGLILTLLAFAAPVGPIEPGIVLAAIAGLMGLSVFTSLRSLKLVDELNVSIARETAAAAFYLMLIVGGGWSIFAHLGFVTALAPLDWLSLFAVMLFAGAFWANGRRGLLLPE